MKMMFLLFFDDVASERELMKVIPERLDYLWFLGYGLEAGSEFTIAPNQSLNLPN